MRAMAGEYRSEELGAVYRISADGNGLVLHHPLQGAGPLRPIAQDEFGYGGLRLRFERAANGEATGFRIDAGRVRNIGFSRAR
jgi:hypothetical protein